MLEGRRVDGRVDEPDRLLADRQTGIVDGGEDGGRDGRGGGRAVDEVEVALDGDDVVGTLENLSEGSGKQWKRRTH